MSIQSTHPLYSEWLPVWIQMLDTYAGPKAVKDRSTSYLPATASHYHDGYPNGNTQGFRDYTAYKDRAVFPDFVADAVHRMAGIMHRKPARVEVPKAMEPMLEDLTNSGEDVECFLRRLTEAQLTTGRCGLLLDVPNAQGPNALPYIVFYAAPKVINWDTGMLYGKKQLRVVVLDESQVERLPFQFDWKLVKRYRLLALASAMPDTMTFEGGARTGEQADLYVTGTATEDNALFPAKMVVPSIAGTTLDVIPFTFLNAIDFDPCPADPPLRALSDLALVVYRGEADYRQSLFMQGQDTFVIVGGSAAPPGEGESRIRTGAGALLELPAGGDAKYVGVGSAGLTEQRSALDADYRRAQELGASLISVADDGQAAASGDALRIRTAAATSSLTSIAKAGAAALQQQLRWAAMWKGLDPEEVVVEPNLEFADHMMSGTELTALQTAKNLGAPISAETIHRAMQRGNLTDKTFDDEQEAIDEEKPRDMTGSGDPAADPQPGEPGYQEPAGGSDNPPDEPT